MIIAREPWHVRHSLTGSSELRSADDTLIGMFPDGNNAEHVIQMADRIKELEDDKDQKVLDLEEEVDSLKEHVRSLTTELEEANANLKAAQDELGQSNV